MFMRIAKAYAALTDEESRKNWEEFGNPDGPQATSFGIALPAWIVDQKNSILVLLVYGLAFMVILPVVVGSWWYRSIRYSGDQILIRTTQIYTYFVYKTRNMDMKRLIMVLAGASEFDPQYNKDATSRPADNIQIPQLIREIGGINLKKNEPPLTCPYSLKARVLLLTHLARMKVPESLEEDQQFILKKSPALLQEMINVICQLIIMARSREAFISIPCQLFLKEMQERVTDTKDSTSWREIYEVPLTGTSILPLWIAKVVLRTVLLLCIPMKAMDTTFLSKPY